ncbi:condensation domain-containing protein [Haloechinothrix halophila]|uniref:condensation domain-containing protein n=1 Tax=Haloechinothrix halophila TaxID=1069073 RepID=UPI000405BAEC|nr:condensation domain-containing protein [Haloechinothrix halophila]
MSQQTLTQPSAEQARLIERQVEDALRQRDGVADCAVVYAGAGATASANCVRCGISDAFPGIGFDDGGVCDLCTMYATHQDEIHSYFGDLDEMVRLLKERAAAVDAPYDCLLLFSGGKDSSYVLYRLVDLGLRVMTFTFDNGFISKTALRNVERITSELGIEHVTKTRADQRKVFLESLRQHKSVCNGCFRSLLDLSTELAHERGIPSLVTGLSRGQIIDERLSWFYQNGIFDPAQIEPKLAMGRRIYHSEEATIQQAAVDAVEVVDFYRYSDVTKDGIKALLQERSSLWSQPADTGFCSSNCMINDVGVYVHNAERGFHNYEAPTRWEVRLGHLRRAEADAELREPVNIERVKRMLAKIGYPDPESHALLGDRLTAYVVPRDAGDSERLRAGLAEVLPEFLLPATWVDVDEIPRTAGKVVREQLRPARASRFGVDTSPTEPPRSAPLTAPLTETQRVILRETGDVDQASMALLLELSGDIDASAAKRIVLQVLLHHDALRLRFTREDGEWSQCDGGMPTTLPVSKLDLSGKLSDEERLTATAVARLRSRLSVTAGPLVGLAVVERGALPTRLLLVVHQLATDTPSLRRLLDDLATAVRQSQAGEPLTLPDAASFLDQCAADDGPVPAATATPDHDVLPATDDGGDRVRMRTQSPDPAHRSATDVARAIASALADWTGGDLAIDTVDHTSTNDHTRPVGALTEPVQLDIDTSGQLMTTGRPSARASVRYDHFGEPGALYPSSNTLAVVPWQEIAFAPAWHGDRYRIAVTGSRSDGELTLDWWCSPAMRDRLAAAGVPQRVADRLGASGSR